ncbi:MAG: hypothetical protein HN348_21900 [Proteobacteria bacterium]|jgi:hypothetical protein|nr:hypothetical protein [Pseudomonadota bacterium]
MNVTGLVLMALLSCKSQPSDEPAPIPDFRHDDFYAALQTYTDDFTRIDGDWKEDWGDASFYGLAFFSHVGTETNNTEYLAIASECHDRNMSVLDEQTLLTGDVNEISMSLFGLMEHMEATGDQANVDALDTYVATLSSLLELASFYIPAEAIGSWAVDAYGPNTINGLLGLICLQWADLNDDHAALNTAEKVVAQINEEAWNGTHYDFSDERPGLYLYPNVALMLLNARLFQLTTNSEYRTQAQAAYEGIQPLRVDSAEGLAGPGRYRSPYSAETMGAQTDDYTTLSSQNYLMMALMVLYEITGDGSYLTEVDQVLDFVEDQLVGDWCRSEVHQGDCCPEGQVCVEDEYCFADACQTGVLHHWMDNRAALATDNEFICTGCNLQTLYVMWYRQQLKDLPEN